MKKAKTNKANSGIEYTLKMQGQEKAIFSHNLTADELENSFKKGLQQARKFINGYTKLYPQKRFELTLGKAKNTFMGGKFGRFTLDVMRAQIIENGCGLPEKVDELAKERTMEIRFNESSLSDIIKFESMRDVKLISDGK